MKTLLASTVFVALLATAPAFAVERQPIKPTPEGDDHLWPVRALSVTAGFQRQPIKPAPEGDDHLRTAPTLPATWMP